MARRLLKSLGAGVAAALLFGLVWLFGLERVVVATHDVPVAARPSSAIATQPSDGVVVADEVVAETITEDPYIVPLKCGVFAVVSIWMFRRQAVRNPQ